MTIKSKSVKDNIQSLCMLPAPSELNNLTLAKHQTIFCQHILFVWILWYMYVSYRVHVELVDWLFWIQLLMLMRVTFGPLSATYT